MTEVCVISCGLRKVSATTAAHRLYTGSYFRAQLEWARSRYPAGRIRILSAKYGLVRLTDQISPYDLKMGMPGSITADRLADQIVEQLPAGATIVTSCGAKYLKPLRAAAAMTGYTVVEPFPNAGKMGKKKALIIKATRHRSIT